MQVFVNNRGSGGSGGSPFPRSVGIDVSIGCGKSEIMCSEIGDYRSKNPWSSMVRQMKKSVKLYDPTIESPLRIDDPGFETFAEKSLKIEARSLTIR